MAQEERWTFETVKAQLREMAHDVERLAGRVGPASDKGFWPEPTLYANVTDQDRWHWYEGVRDGTREPPRMGYSVGGRAVALAEQALWWPWRYLSAPERADEREALQVWLWCEARRQSFPEEAKALGCGRRTAYDRRDRAIRIILAGLVRDGA